ncbi:MAG: hypothetical protein QUS07_03230 [Methanothrix sp.]|nr:hypothetical protein [Methanothrix sp.]
MRLMSILSSAILLSCLSIQAHAIEPGDIAVPSMSIPNMDMPTPRISSPNMDMPKTKPVPLAKPASSNQTLNQTANISANQTRSTLEQKEDTTMNVSGKWSMKFDDLADRSLDLTLWVSGGTIIMGYGTLTGEGEKKSVTASGSVTGNELHLTTKSATPENANQKNDQYDLDLFWVNNTISGTYILRSGGEFAGEGNVTAVKH